MQIEKCYVLDCTSEHYGKRIHIISEDSRWNTLPTLDGQPWGYLNSKRVYADNYVCDCQWTNLVPERKGCKATYIRFDNGSIIVL